MIAFLEFVGIAVIVFGLLMVLVDWIAERHPSWRSTVAFLIALGSAYATSFALDLLFGSLPGAYTIKPYTLPVFVWGGYGAGLHSLARLAATGPNPIRLAYFLIGCVAVHAGFVGSHRHNYFVGAGCLAITLVCCVFPLAACGRAPRTDPNSITDLMARAFEGNTEAVRELLARGVDINARDSRGHTALMSAALNGHTQTVQFLLDRGAAVDSRDDGGRTALIVAALNGHVESVRLLLDRGANVNTTDKDGATALIAASGEGHSETVELLLAKHAEVNSKTVNGRTALLLAAAEGRTGVVRSLLARGADVNAATNDGATPLKVATYNGRAEIVQLLKQAGARE